MSDEYNIVKDNLNFYRTSQPLSVNPNAKNNYLKNWPILYILTEGLLNKKSNKLKKAYVGQTTNGLNRMQEHVKNSEKDDLDTVNFVYFDEFNQSVTFDYESKLIQLIAADESYKLITKIASSN